eukprot:TRINITY_DN77771_c0_g1_i1.p1 TRINITY_DN77771_c0_g1~~TRINITY_DN77771_c0_g1_i1.p1  ORF type:complete len:833 (+),score=156.90 TRINITY_DN77771_c0_g1_i1:39-2501(+)
MRGQAPSSGGHVADVSRALFSLASVGSVDAASNFDRVFCYEVADTARVAEALEADKVEGSAETVPPDAVYAVLGGEQALVNPVLAGQCVLVCCYGSEATCLQVLQSIFLRVAEEMSIQAKSMAGERLLRLGASLVECGQQESDFSFWLDALRNRDIDLSSLDDHVLASTSQPLQEAEEAFERSFTRLEQQSRARSTAGLLPRHHVLEFSAGHANEKGTMTFVFIAMPQDDELPATSQSSAALNEHIESLYRVCDMLSRPRKGFTLPPLEHGESCPKTSLLLFAPRQTPTLDQSLALSISAECFRLKEEPEHEHGKPRVDFGHDGFPSQQQGSTFALNPYKFDSPPESDHMSWGSASPTPSVGSSPDPLSARQQLLPPPAQGTLPGASPQKGASVTPSTGSASAAQLAAVTPRAGLTPPILQRFAELSDFNVQYWWKHAQEHGKRPEEQVSELVRLVLDLQEAVKLLSAHVQKASPSDGCGARLRWSHSQGPLAGPGSLRVEGPAIRAGSPRVPASRPPLRSQAGNLGAGSPRIPVGSEGRSPGGGAAADSDGVLSPLTRSRSANYPVGSMLNYAQKGGSALNIHGEAVSPKMPARDISPSRTRSFMQVKNSTLPKTASPPPPLHGQQQRNLVPYSFGPSFQTVAMPAFPPPVPAGASAVDPQMVLSPRKEQRDAVLEGGGARSPMPAPPGQQLPLTKVRPSEASTQPHSARTNGPVIMQVASRTVVGMGNAQGAEVSPSNLRWEQPSPCRAQTQVRYVPAAPGKAPSYQGGPAAAQGTTRAMPGPPPKAAMPSLAARLSEAPRVYHAGPGSSPTKVMRQS